MKITDPKKAYSYYQMGMTIKQIAEYYGVGGAAVRKSFRVRKWKMK